MRYPVTLGKNTVAQTRVVRHGEPKKKQWEKSNENFNEILECSFSANPIHHEDKGTSNEWRNNSHRNECQYTSHKDFHRSPLPSRHPFGHGSISMQISHVPLNTEERASSFESRNRLMLDLQKRILLAKTELAMSSRRVGVLLPAPSQRELITQTATSTNYDDIVLQAAARNLRSKFEAPSYFSKHHSAENPFRLSYDDVHEYARYLY